MQTTATIQNITTTNHMTSIRIKNYKNTHNLYSQPAIVHTDT